MFKIAVFLYSVNTFFLPLIYIRLCCADRRRVCQARSLSMVLYTRQSCLHAKF